jgi:hypothetical protein
MDKSKNRTFLITLGLIGLIFVAGCGLTVRAWLEKKQTQIELERHQAQLNVLLAGDNLGSLKDQISLTPGNVDLAEKDLTELTDHLKSLREVLAGSPEAPLKPDNSTSASKLNSLIKQNVDEWKKLCTDRDVKMPPNDQCEFGFRRYIRNAGTSPKRDLPRVDLQRIIIDYLFKQLLESRPAGAPLLLQSIDREPIETYVLIPEGKPNAGAYVPDSDGSKNENDEFTPSRSFRRPGLVDALSFRIRFVGTTSTLRTFINKLRSSGHPFAITSLEVGLAKPEEEKLLAVAAPAATATAPAAGATAAVPDFFLGGGAPTSAKSGAAPKEDRVVVVKEKPSEFVIQFDYLTIPEEKSANAAEGEPKK